MKPGSHWEERRARRKEHYDREDVNGKLVLCLRDINHTMRLLDGGKGGQTRILVILREKGTITQRELTQRLGIQPGSASEAIAKLEGAGLVERVSSREDRRTADISLTEEGRRQADAAIEQRPQRHKELFSALSDEEKAQLLALLEKVSRDREAHCAHPCGLGQDGRG